MGQRIPAIGDKTYNLRVGEGKIAHFTAPKFPAINKAEIAGPDGKFQTYAYPERMTWDEQFKRWLY